MENNDIIAAVEAILFASGDPVPVERLAMALEEKEEKIIEAADSLREKLEAEGHGIRLVSVNESLQLCSAAEWADKILLALEQRKPPKLTQAALEVISIVAYYQPVTRAYVEQIRGVDSSYTVGLLTDRGLIEQCGKLDVPGRPTLFRTTELFLRTLGIASLDELPPLPDMTTDEGMEKLQSAIEALKVAEEGQIVILDDGSLA